MNMKDCVVENSALCMKTKLLQIYLYMLCFFYFVVVASMRMNFGCCCFLYRQLCRESKCISLHWIISLSHFCILAFLSTFFF